MQATDVVEFADDLGRLPYTRALLGGRNAFDPRCPGGGIRAVAAAAKEPECWVFAGAGDNSQVLTSIAEFDLGEFEDQLPSAAAELERAREESMHSSEWCHSPNADRVGVVVVMHCRSGLRLEMKRRSSGLLEVDSRPGASFDQCRRNGHKLYDSRGAEWWWRYCGLGIGKRLYIEALHQIGGGRVGVYGTPTQEALQLRATLHRVDPYVWKDPECRLSPCSAGPDGWQRSGRQDMH